MNFRKLPEIQPLSLNEQTKKYNQYISELTYQRNVYLHWLEGHKKGALTTTTTSSSPEPRDTDFLLLEDGDFLLSEDSDKIIL